MDATTTSELPRALRRIQLQIVGRQEIQGEPVNLSLPPVPVQPGVVISGVVGNHSRLSEPASAEGTKLLRELPAGQGVELTRLTPEEEAAVAQADRPIIAHALPGGRVKQYGILGFGRDPHLTTRTVLRSTSRNCTSLRRGGRPEEVAAVVYSLASDDASFVTGQCYDVSGGRVTY